VRTYELLAIGLVLLIPVAALALVAGAIAWARDSIDRAPLIGGAGVLCTALALANTLVERACGGEVNRAVITAFTGPDGCRSSALAALQLVVLLAVGTAVAVRAPELRRWRPAGPAPAPGAGGGSSDAP